MIFQHTWEKVLLGEKTQTRRQRKPLQYYFKETCQVEKWQRYLTWKTVYAIGKTYAVQPARTAKGIARIQIMSIRREDVRQISEADARAEGFDSPELFWLKWCEMYDPLAAVQVKRFIEAVPDVVNGVSYPGFRVMKPTEDRELYYYTAKDYLAQRPAERYDAWVLTFALVPEPTR